MRTGAEYLESLHDGRKVWVMGEGEVADVTIHPATAAMVQQYVAWYDRHTDPAWQDVLLTPPDAHGERFPYTFITPMSTDDLRRMGQAFSATLFLSAGNITHTPAYGNLIALGMLDAVQRHNPSPEYVDPVARYRDEVAQTGRFLTFAGGGPTIGARLRPAPNDRAAMRLIKETDAGMVVSGKVGMHTSVPFAEEVYIGGRGAVTCGPHQATFVVPVAGSGVTVACRKIAARHSNAFIAPLSSRFDELDAQMWLDHVFIPWERVFFTEPPPGTNDPPPLEPRRGQLVTSWLFWHQLYGWLAKAEFTLGLALACAEVMSLWGDENTIAYLVDLVVDVQTVQSCLIAAECDPEVTQVGACIPGLRHIAVGSMAMLKARQRMAELLRIVPGSSLVVAPADTDLAAPEMAEGLEDAFGGGGYTALQRAALLHMAWDHIASGLDGRESAFELHANGGIPIWRNRLRSWFDRYNTLANGVLDLLDVAMPSLDLDHFRAVSQGLRRTVSAADQTRDEPTVRTRHVRQRP